MIGALKKWDRLAVQSKKYKVRRSQGLSLIESKEMNILKNKNLNTKETAMVLSIKAIFDGEVIA